MLILIHTVHLGLVFVSLVTAIVRFIEWSLEFFFWKLYFKQSCISKVRNVYFFKYKLMNLPGSFKYHLLHI